MGEEAAWRGSDIDRGDAFRASFAKRLLTRWGPAIGLTSFFFLTVMVYYLTNSASGWPWEWRWPAATGFNGPVRVADAFLHGRVDVANGADLPYLEWAPYKGKYYAIDPPMSALVLLPGVILYGLALNQTLVSIVIGGITASAIYRLMRGLTEKLSV